MPLFRSAVCLLRDVRLAIGKAPSGSDDANIVSLGEDDGAAGLVLSARIRVGVQVFLTLAVIAMCIMVIQQAEPKEDAVKLAHTGLGVVLGYWLR